MHESLYLYETIKYFKMEMHWNATLLIRDENKIHFLNVQ